MRPYSVSLLAAFFAVALPAFGFAQSSKSKKDPEWQSHESDAFKYKTVFPGKPKDVAKRHESKAGEILVSTWSYEGKDLFYAVTATQYPDALTKADPKLILLAAKDALSANGGKILADGSVAMTGPDDAKLEGRDVIVEFGKSRVRTRLLLADRILYQVSLTGTEKGHKNESGGKFLAAFEVTK